MTMRSTSCGKKPGGSCGGGASSEGCAGTPSSWRVLPSYSTARPVSSSCSLKVMPSYSIAVPVPSSCSWKVLPSYSIAWPVPSSCSLKVVPSYSIAAPVPSSCSWKVLPSYSIAWRTRAIQKGDLATTIPSPGTGGAQPATVFTAGGAGASRASRSRATSALVASTRPRMQLMSSFTFASSRSTSPRPPPPGGWHRCRRARRLAVLLDPSPGGLAAARWPACTPSAGAAAGRPAR
mmetsp:Transcript_18869/g.53290  ORF Transcript_18869/g.53290 Transcript_18869/m.53290 type:complete len:235 (+) Transcript_18869:545-1249(+)